MDGLPGQICIECVDTLRQSIQFKQQCENAYETLKSVLGVSIESASSFDLGVVDSDTGDAVESDSSDHLHTDTRIEPQHCGPNEKSIQTEDICFYPCEMCELKFFKEEALKEHRLMHKNTETGFKCRNCDRNYTRLSHLRRHINAAHPEVNISGKLNDIYCKQCDKHFTRHEHLRRHIMVLHPEQTEMAKSKLENDSETTVKCGGCSLVFQNQHCFDLHENCETKIA